MFAVAMHDGVVSERPRRCALAAGPPRSSPELRRARRHPVDYRVICQRRPHAEIDLHIVNISHSGFMALGAASLGKGERVTVPLPTVGRVDAFLVWSDGTRAGFQIERLLRNDEFSRLLAALPHP